MKKSINEGFERKIIAIGESIIKNAASIAGTEEYCAGISIHVIIDTDSEQVAIPEIDIHKTFFPERLVNND